MGQKAREMLKLIPEANLQVIERCSGHGGTWGYRQAEFRHGHEGGRAGRPPGSPTSGKASSPPNARSPAFISRRESNRSRATNRKKPRLVGHPIELMAEAYELSNDQRLRQAGTAHRVVEHPMTPKA